MSVLAQSRDLHLTHENGPTIDPHAPASAAEQTRSRLVGRVLRRSQSNLLEHEQSFIPPTPQDSRQRSINESTVIEGEDQSDQSDQSDQKTPLRYPQRLNNGNNKPLPLPPPPALTTPTIPKPKPTLRSRFSTEPTSGNRLETEILGFQHVASDSSGAAPSRRGKKVSYYHSTTGDQWPRLDLDPPPPPLRDATAQGRTPTRHHAVDVEEGKRRESSEDHAGPSDYELFIRRAQEEDRHYREQLLRKFSRRSRGDDVHRIKHRDPGTRVFSWQRAASKRQPEMDTRQSWGGGGQPQKPTIGRRNSDVGRLLKRKGSLSSLSSIKQAIVHYIRPPRSPKAPKE